MRYWNKIWLWTEHRVEKKKGTVDGKYWVFLFFLNLENHATSKKVKEVLYKIGLKTKIGLRGSKSTSQDGVSTLHPTKGTNCAWYKNNKIFWFLWLSAAKILICISYLLKVLFLINTTLG